MMRYLTAGGKQIIIIGDGALAHMTAHRQLRARDPEAGGQLFARFEGKMVHVVEATGPRWADKRSRFLFVPSRWAEHLEIKQMHKRGLHYVGDWHTHPEARPIPSGTDVTSMKVMFKDSVHQLAGFMMVIVGTDDSMNGLFVGVVDGNGVQPLTIAGEGNALPDPRARSQVKRQVRWI